MIEQDFRDESDDDWAATFPPLPPRARRKRLAARPGGGPAAAKEINPALAAEGNSTRVGYGTAVLELSSISMGKINFDCPDHRPLPTSFPSATQTVVVAGVTAVLYGACPKNDEHDEHPLHEQQQEISLFASDLSAGISSTGGNGSTSGDPMTWQNNSMFESARVAINARLSVRDAHTRLAGMSSMSSPAVLLSSQLRS